MKKLNNVDMSSYTSFKTGGQVRRLVIVDQVEELQEVLSEAKGEYLLLGNGTNTLFAAPEYDGLVIKLGEGFDYLEYEGDGLIRVGGATLLSRLSKFAASHDLTGLEFAGGIPGSVGGAVFMNAGAYEGEMKDVLESVLVSLSDATEVKEIKAEDLELSYRHSCLMDKGGIVLEARFRLQPGDHDEILAKMKDFSERRTSKQPLEYPSAGSFFKRPTGSFAGKLIEDAGLKGFTVGGAQISEKHAGFVINKGGATPEDILTLMKEVQSKVKEESGVDLEPEVRIIL